MRGDPHWLTSSLTITRSVATACIAVMLQELETACDPAFAAILKIPWSRIENVSGRSAYVVDLVSSIKSVTEIVRERIESQKYMRNFADKAVGVVLKRFTGAVVKSRPLKKVGAEQVSSRETSKAREWRS